MDDCRATSWTISDAEGLIEPARVKPEVADQLSGGRENTHVAVGDEDQHPSPLVGSSDGHVVEVRAIAQRDLSGVDLVLADPTVRRDDHAFALGSGLLAGGERDEGGSSPKRTMRAHLVVVGDEGVELCLEVRQRARPALGAQILLEGLVEARPSHRSGDARASSA